MSSIDFSRPHATFHVPSRLPAVVLPVHPFHGPASRRLVPCRLPLFGAGTLVRRLRLLVTSISIGRSF